MALVLVNDMLVFSTFYGLEGQKELSKLRKKLRLGRETVLREGHPTEEAIKLPSAKIPSLRQSLPVMTRDGLETLRIKEKAVKPVVETLVSPTPAYEGDEWGDNE